MLDHFSLFPLILKHLSLIFLLLAGKETLSKWSSPRRIDSKCDQKYKTTENRANLDKCRASNPSLHCSYMESTLQS